MQLIEKVSKTNPHKLTHLINITNIVQYS